MKIVTLLLTISIKVNVLGTASAVGQQGDMTMKKQTQATRGFWSWVLGGGWTNTGSRA
jgi:hypothetical protein